MAQLKAIPKVFHRIWLDPDGTDPIPERFEGYWDRFQELHPDWEFRTWSTTEDVDFRNVQGVWDVTKTHAGRADVLRYLIMFNEGGVYVDTDVEPLRPFDELLQQRKPFAAWENERLICPTVLGSPPEHPAFEAVLDFLVTWAPRMPGVKPNYQTGPVPFTKVWNRRTDVRILPRETFYPIGWWEKDKLGGPYPEESLCVHWWDMGWAPGKAGVPQ